VLDPHFSSFLIGNKLKFLKSYPYKYGYLWEVEKIKEPHACLRCGSLQTVRAGRCTSTVREEPIRARAIWLKIHKHRIYCKECKRTFAESVPGIWPRRRSTQRFRKSVAQACAKMADLSSVSRSYRVSHGFTYAVYYEQAEIKLREYQSRTHWPEVIGVDEHFFRRVKGRGTEFVTMFTDLRRHKVFEMAHGKESVLLFNQLNEILGREKVKLVVMDLSSHYRSFIKKFFPNAEIIADKFHVLRLLTPSIMRQGKEIHGHRQELRTRRKLLYSRQRLDYFAKVEIDQYLKNHEAIRELYWFKEKLFEFYRIKGRDRAERSYLRLLEQMKESKHEAIKRLRRTLENWKKEVLQYFSTRYTNGFTERMNGTGKLVQRRGFGYKSFKNYRIRTLSACLIKVF
jgi:transposase